MLRDFMANKKRWKKIYAKAYKSHLKLMDAMALAYGADEFHPLAEVWRRYLENPTCFKTDPIVKAAFEAAAKEMLIQRGIAPETWGEMFLEDDDCRITFTE